MKSKALHNQIECATAKALARKLSEKQSGKQAVSPDDNAAFESHIATCADCKTDFALLQLFLDDHHSGLDELSSKRCREAAIAHARSQYPDMNIEPLPSAPLPPPVSQRPIALVAIAAGILIMIGIGAMLLPRHGQPEKNVVPRTEAGSPTLTANDMPMDGQSSGNAQLSDAAVYKEDAAPSTSLLNPASGVLVYTEENTLVSIAERTEDSLTLDLQTGAIWVDVNPKIAHPAVTVKTPDGSVRVTGTVFRVAKSKRFVVQVLRGKVEVHNTQGRHAVTAGYESKLKDTAVNAIDTNLQATLTASWKKRIDNKRSAFSAEPEQDDSSSSIKTIAAPPKKQQPSFASLIATAREKKAQSDFNSAIEAYQKLIRLYPSKPESKAALVTVGQLYLKMGNASLAEKAFRQYQTQGNTLLGPEALLGEIDALRMQGKTDDELNALKLFTRIYSQSLHMHRVEKRIAQIESE